MITGINHITIATKKLEQLFSFYKDILGFKPICKWHNGAYFLIGELWFCINYDEHYQADNSYTHVAFNVTSNDFERVKKRIIANNSIIFKDNKSEGDSLYFLDPDNHKLELHVGDWQTRIASKKQDIGNWKDVEFFV